MEKFFLSLFFFVEKLNIIDEQDVNRAVFLAESFRISFDDGINKFVGKFFTRYVENAHIGIIADDLVADGVHEVGFAKADAAVHKERIIDGTGRFRYGERRCVCEAVGITNNEFIEGIVRV